MDLPAKKCKSVNSKTKGLGCKKLTKFRRFGLCNTCYINWLLTTDEGKAYLQASKITGKKKAEKKLASEERKKRLDMKDELTDWKVLLQKKVNEISRLIDLGRPCLATERHPNQMHGGHVFSRGSQQTMRYNLHNIHRQSAQSNWHQSDDLKMQEGLVREYGQGYLDFVNGLKSTPALKYSKTEWNSFYRKACKISNSLRKEGNTFDKDQRIKERNRVNIKLGIYSYKNSNYDNQRRQNRLF